jgi:hypothetical protein
VKDAVSESQRLAEAVERMHAEYLMALVRERRRLREQ